jgi:hypothetical protein
MPSPEAIDFTGCLSLSPERASELVQQGWCSNLRVLELPGCSHAADLLLSIFIRACPRIESVNIAESPSVSDAGIRFLVDNTSASLKHVNISSCGRLTVDALCLLGTCAGLLTVDASFVNLAGLQSLDHFSPNLLQLDLSGCPGLSARPIRQLLVLSPHLRDLVLHNTEDDTFVLLTRQFSALRTLGLNGCGRLTDEGMCALSRAFPFLARLSLTAMGRGVGEIGARAVAVCPLSFLALADCPYFTNEALASLVFACPSLCQGGRLAIQRCSEITVEKMMALPEGVWFWFNQHTREELEEDFQFFA